VIRSLSGAGFDVKGTGYEAFITRYFASRA
jgi:hypothetical protein